MAANWSRLTQALDSMKDFRDDHQIKSLTPPDYLASLLRSVVGAVPFAGTFLTEVLGTIIPKQRMDRVAEFSIELGNRVSRLEESQVVTKISQDRIGEIVEEATRQAARSTSTERREYLASLVSCAITSEEQESNDERHLLRILGELNDKEIIWLRSYATRWSDFDEFRELHQKILDTPYVTYDAPDEIRNTAALHESYNSHLISLGLLKQEIKDDGASQPEFDRHSGQFKLKYPEVTHLGEMLLLVIGLHPEQQATV